MDTKFNKNFEYRGTHLDAKLDNKLDSKLDMVHPKPSHPESVAFYFWQLPPATFYFLMLPLTSSYVFLLPPNATYCFLLPPASHHVLLLYAPVGIERFCLSPLQLLLPLRSSLLLQQGPGSPPKCLRHGTSIK